MAARYDFIIVGGGSAGCALANRLSADPSTRVLVLEAGRPDYRFDVFIHMPAALTFPIGSRFYDWKYESEPEPFMNGRRIYHARGKVLGGSTQHQRDDLPARQPARLRALGGRPGHGRWDYAHCLPYFKRMENCLAAAPDDPWRGHAGPLVLERGPATSPLFGAFFQAVQEAGYPLTDDVNGYRQEGFAAFDRNIRRGRRLSARRGPTSIRSMRRPNLEVRTRAFVTRDPVRGPPRGRRRVLAGGRPAPTARAGEVILCGGAFNTPQLLQLSGVGPAAELAGPRDPGRRTTCRASARTSRTTSRSTSSTRCTQPVSMQPSPQKWRRPWIGFQWLFLRRGPGATNHFEGGGFVRGNDDVAYPNLMFHFLPLAIRYDGTAPAGAATATRSTSGRCTRTRAAR